MKKKIAFLVSILICISMVMTNFAGFGNTLKEVKANDKYTITVSSTVMADDVWFGAYIEDGNLSFTGENGEFSFLGEEGTEVSLSVDYNPNYIFKGWKIVSGSGTITEGDDGEYYYIIGNTNSKIQAIFEEKESHPAFIEEWLVGENPNKPQYTNAQGSTVETEGVYYVDALCEYFTEHDRDGAEEVGSVPTKPGTYYVKFFIEGDEKYKNEEKILKFNIRKKINITANNNEETYKPGLTYDVSTLFEIPDVAGTPSYEIVANKDNTVAAGAGTIDGDTLTIEKVGTITIQVTTAQTDTVASASAEATLTVNPAKITSNMLNLAPDSYI
ncbi:MAG: hypothetical protein K5795_05630, partial [Lachnospiraceae bacterium]|nr:hypothetical protein [Lachnospiraceae bacterium]